MTTRQGNSSNRRHPSSEVFRDGLLQQIFRISSHERGTGLVVAFTGVDRHSGVSTIAEILAEELGGDNGGSVICLDCRTLTEMGTLYVENTLSRMAISSSRMEDEEGLISPWCDSYSQRKAILAQLRTRFQYILIDCPSMKESHEMLGIADLVDGIVMVMEANRTQVRQIQLLEQTILAVGGNILGCILNKRAYFIPNWLYSLLGKFSA